MQNKALVTCLLLIFSGLSMAEGDLAGNAAEQTAKNAANTAAPEAAERTDALSRILKDIKHIKETVKNAPAEEKDQVKATLKEAVKRKLAQATPEQVEQGAEALKSGKEAVKQLKGQAENLPESSGQAAQTLKLEAKRKIAEKALQMLH